MNYTSENGLQPKDLKGQALEKVIENWNKSLKKLEKIQIQINIKKDHQIIYSKDGAILRIEEIHSISKNPQIFSNMEQIENLFWQGQFDKRKFKVGKWIASWNKAFLKDVGGYFVDGQKQGLWKDLFLNYCYLMNREAQVFETGEYCADLRIGNWDFIWLDKKLSGGFYNKNGLKQGKWVEFDEIFGIVKQVTYTGEYNIQGKKVGKWDIMYKYRDYFGNEDKEYKQIGGGIYGEGQIKIGRWIELWENFGFNRQVTFNGEYNIQGIKVGKWNILYKGQQMQIFSNGGGTYDDFQGQIKIGRWVELWENFGQNREVTFNGEYNIQGMKVGRWDIMYKDCDYFENEDKQYKQIGGGLYGKGQIKIGRWIELIQHFGNHREITFDGLYNMKGMKVGKWDIVYKGQQMWIMYDSGGGSYGEGEKGCIKIGMWVELDEMFGDSWGSNQITYQGEYNLKGMKIGIWVQNEDNILKSIII
ncbi:unnamed protein product [Paramecium sonneborni]|uniref:Uncharacterized protein n=1 Tax=Paramecium sonneborni TaxID=65129 RepID=A0A8S1RLP9_9CILI|nr:unnamed protein product [Paramecium sonneborni]